MKMKRITSLLLTVLLVLGSINFTAIGVFAADINKDAKAKYQSYFTAEYNSAEDRIAAMELYAVVDGMEIYCDSFSGEVAVKEIASGQVLLTNPYSVGSSKASQDQKTELLSQIIVEYSDNGQSKFLNSFKDAMDQITYSRQINVERIKNGLRVEYSLGSEQSRLLVPKLINKERFQTEILANVTDAAAKSQLLAFYSLKDPAMEKEKIREAIYKRWPITEEMPIYVLPTDGNGAVTANDQKDIEAIIKQYCPAYTFEDLDYDHSLTKFEGIDREPVNFRMALEYVIDNGQLVVTLPANGILYNEEEYTLENITILPYMGAGTNPNSGYTFLPDGSGAIFKFEELVDTTTTIFTDLYGVDYAYQTITGTYQQPGRIPVYGLVENEDVYRTVAIEKDIPSDLTTDDDAADVAENAESDEPKTETVYEKEFVRNQDRGFVAIIEEGEAMSKLTTYHGGAMHEYNTIKLSVTPRPKDSYNLSTAISVGSNDIWTVVSERRYTGNYKVRYVMLTDDTVAAENDLTDTYETSWKGMAEAYRDYLIDKGIITKLTDADLGDGIPLYIETFGSMESIEKILSIPVTVMTAMTSFENVQTMYNDLSSEGIKNINFKLTGYANGGMTSTVPYKLKWEKSVGGKDGFEALLADAKEKDYGIYPDFDFAYINKTSMFDGVSLKKHAVKSIDNRYTSKRIYSAARQNYASYFQLALSPAYYYRFIDKLAESYTQYDPIGISVSTLGNTLNSDFDQKEPYNREDSKNYTIDAFESLGASYNSVMTSGGNAYTWKEADHILEIPLDSSRYNIATYTVPFIGYVLHGYKNFTGSAINMAGDIRYEVLKCIENGAYMYFIMSYDNTELLKDDELLSKYYSIRYDIWQEDVIELYKELNEVLEPLQTQSIVDHEFLIGQRILAEGEELDEDNMDKYTTMDDGRIVKVTYENGTTFILNYNYFGVTVEGQEIDAYGYVKLN